MSAGDGDRRDDRAVPGRWVPLKEAVGEVDTLRRLVCRLVGDGKLRSREGADGDIEVWIRDADLSTESVSPPLDVIRPGHPATPDEQAPLTLGRQLSVLIGPLAGSFERNVELAHQNGILSERTAGLERELKALRDATTSDRRASEQAKERLRVLESTDIQPARAAPARDEDRSTGPRRSWIWLAGALLCLAAVPPGTWSARSDPR